MSSLNVAIVGGGPAGLTLARLLQLQSIPCTVFELDSDLNGRDQGGTVDLHPRGGQLALQEAGLIEEFQIHARPEGEAMKLLRRNGTVIYDENTMGHRRPEQFANRPEIDRTKLRGLLLDSLQPGTVAWGKKLQSVKESPSSAGKYDLHFQDGTEKGFDLVVGADGAWSKVRASISDQQPHYSSVTMIETWATDVDKRHRWLSDFVGAGSCAMFDEGRAMMCQRLGDDSIRVYTGVRRSEDWIHTCGIDWSSPNDAREQLVDQYFADCAPEIQRAILDANDRLVPRLTWMLPIGYRWVSHPGITLVGDAAHLMTPFAGVGVNLAMVDSLNLAKALVECAGDIGKLYEAIRKFEDEMLTRAEEYAKKTWKGLVSHFSANGGDEMAAKLNEH